VDFPSDDLQEAAGRRNILCVARNVVHVRAIDRCRFFMPIYPLPQFEADLAEQDRETYNRLKPPSSVVVRFGVMKLVGEFPFDLDVKPGCGTKFVIKSHRGTELGEMLTSTCPNSGCGKSVSRKEMLEYIDNSGGKDYPFFSMQGRVLRVATPEDLNAQMRLDEAKVQMTKQARALAERMMLPMKVIDAEPILGGEKITFYFLSEERVDFRELVHELAAIHHTRIELRQVGSRDEARLNADYEKCGQHCCCKQFLKVLKPVSMKQAKIQKATLDPLKISGRCGRLMCCLRYEEETYDDLRARLPKKRTRVDTAHGVGFVLDSQILTQLVLVQLEDSPEQVAVPLEELTILAPGQNPPARNESEDDREDAAPSPGGPSTPQDRPRPAPPQAQRDARVPGPKGGPMTQNRGGNAPPRDRSSSGQGPGPGTSAGGGAAPGRSDRAVKDGDRQSTPADRRGPSGGQDRGAPNRQPGKPPARDELDEIMDMLESGDAFGGSTPPRPRSEKPQRGDDRQRPARDNRPRSRDNAPGDASPGDADDQA
jgi:cell fate regulator YaaT (PSP1 superfamily)